MIPLHRPWIDQSEEAAVLRVLRRRALAGNGAECAALEHELGSRLDAAQVVAVGSATAALEIAAQLLDLRGRDVILPSFTFPSVANAILGAGGRPVFCEIREPDLNVDPVDAMDRVGKNTAGIVITHYAGHPQDCSWAERPVLEDAAHALGARIADRPCGRMGALGCFSFHQTKNIVAGEGGALICSNEKQAVAARIFREKGTNRDDYIAGRVPYYAWVGPGSSSVLPELSAAIARVQLSKLDRILALRRNIADSYDERLSSLERSERIRIVRPVDGASCHHIYAVLVDPKRRDSVLSAFQTAGVGAASHFVPLHLSPYGKQFASAGSLPRTERLASSLIRLPIYPDLSNEEMDLVVTTLERSFS